MLKLLYFFIIFLCISCNIEKKEDLSQKQKCIDFKLNHYHKEGEKWDNLRYLYDKKCKRWKEYRDFDKAL